METVVVVVGSLYLAINILLQLQAKKNSVNSKIFKVSAYYLKNNGDQRPTRRSLLVNPRFEQKLSQTAH